MLPPDPIHPENPSRRTQGRPAESSAATKTFNRPPPTGHLYDVDLGDSHPGTQPQPQHHSPTSERYDGLGLQPPAITDVQPLRLLTERWPGQINLIFLGLLVMVGPLLSFPFLTPTAGVVITMSLVMPLLLVLTYYWMGMRHTIKAPLFFTAFWMGVAAAVLYALGCLVVFLNSILNDGDLRTGAWITFAVLTGVVIGGLLSEALKWGIIFALKDNAELSVGQAAAHRRIIREGLQLPPLTDEQRKEAARSFPGPRSIRHPLGMVLLGVSIGLGFALVDGIMFPVCFYQSGGGPLAIYRAATAALMHAVFGGMMAERLARNQWFQGHYGFLACLWLPMLMHALFDTILLFLQCWGNAEPALRATLHGVAMAAASGVLLLAMLILGLRVQRLRVASAKLPRVEFRPLWMMPPIPRRQPWATAEGDQGPGALTLQRTVSAPAKLERPRPTHPALPALPAMPTAAENSDDDQLAAHAPESLPEWSQDQPSSPLLRPGSHKRLV